MSQAHHASAHQDHVVRGMAAGMGAHFLFAIMIMLAKLLSASHFVIEIGFYRNLIGSMIWATLFGWMIWNEWPVPAEIAGASMIFASNILIIWRESRLHRRTFTIEFIGSRHRPPE